MLVKIVKKALYHNISTGSVGSVQSFPDDIAKAMIASKIAVQHEEIKKKPEKPVKEVEPEVKKAVVKNVNKR